MRKGCGAAGAVRGRAARLARCGSGLGWDGLRCVLLWLLQEVAEDVGWLVLVHLALLLLRP